MSNIELNIQPKAGILGVFSRLNYKAWYAIGEFVDNSTASFFEHERTMKFFKKTKLTIEIEYDSYLKKLTIKDDAYGMEIEDFKRAVLLDSVPENPNGRNEFGMGLKTAASWFGNIWSVSSTQLNSSNHYYTKIDIKKLRNEDINTVEIKQTQVETLSHGTIVEILDITKPIDAPKTKSKIKDLLSSMYRRDIDSGKVDIYFNGELLKPLHYEVLNFRDKDWKKDVDINFEFNEKNYNVTGFVGIMSNGSFIHAGLSLFRYNRVIIGGPDQNYKPSVIFSQAQSQISLKLFGELNMEDFPVNQAKDGFVWDDGLEDEFLRILKENIIDYIKIADLSKTQRAKEEEFSIETSQRTAEPLITKLQNIIIEDDNVHIEKADSGEETEEELFKREIDQDNLRENVFLEDTERKYTVKLNPLQTETFTVYWEISNDDIWVSYDEETKKIIININHPFFKPYSSQEEFKKLLDKFVLSYIISEELAKSTTSHDENLRGHVLPSTLRNKINMVLKKLSD